MAGIISSATWCAVCNDEGDADTEGLGHRRHALHEPLDRELRRAVGLVEGLSHRAAHAGDGHDPPVRGAEVGYHCLGHGHHAEEVDLHHLADVVEGLVLDGPDVPRTGVVDHDVEVPVVGHHPVDAGRDRRLIGDVEPADVELHPGLVGRGPQRPGAVEVAHGGHDPVAVLAGDDRGGQSDAGRSSGDEEHGLRHGDDLSGWLCPHSREVGRPSQRVSRSGCESPPAVPVGTIDVR